MRILFQGDSITDAGRDKRNYYDLGGGYPKYAAELIKKEFPDAEFIDLGISGNRTDQLFDRLYADAIALEPDVISILIGINDIWHRYGGGKIATTDEQFALNYRTILSQLREKTNAKIMMICPFLLDAPKTQHLRPDLDRIIPIVEKLADEFADVYMPLDAIMAEAMKTQPEPMYFSADGVHPNANGAAYIGEKYAEYITPLLKSL